MFTPRATMEQELKSQEKEITDDINNLNKKVLRLLLSGYLSKNTDVNQAKYLEKQFNEAQAQLRDIVCSFEI